MKIIAVNAGPRKGWNTDILVNKAAEGAKSAGAEVEVVDLYRLEKFTGCVSCFACKREPNKGKCVYKDGLAPLLEKIREADGLIIGSPNYLGDLTAGFRALYERLIFQYITYNKEHFNANTKRIPTLLIIPSNAKDSAYEEGGMYRQLAEKYKGQFQNFIGDTQVYICGDTLQVNNYDIYDWTMFDAQSKKERREKVFPQQCEEVFEMGKNMALGK